jgi:uncharacterized protein YdeI (YjbR/CyaY-like superfamily)
LVPDEQRHFVDRAAWRAWLERNHDAVRVIWLIFFKKHTGVPTISYDAAVEEALCFGWIDSLIKRLDEDRFVRKFTPRAPGSKWSQLNLERVEKLQAAGAMTPAGLAKVGRASSPGPRERGGRLTIPRYFREALARDEAAQTFFARLAPSYRRDFVRWVDAAKRDSTRRKRLAEAIDLLRNGRRLGMK